MAISMTISQKQKAKIVLYSHDTQGLGHTRRNLAIATALAKSDPSLSILMITGTREVTAFDLPAGVDCLTLPSLGKDERGHYQPRSLKISRQRLIRLRAGIIQAAVEAFSPDVLIADKVPLGVDGELEPSLAWLRSQPHVRCILGLREILDDPETVRREWYLAGSEVAVAAYYDAVWVYGDPRVYDAVHEYTFSTAMTAKVRYTGYLDRQAISQATLGEADQQLQLNLPPGQLALCMVGGGQDGDQLAGTFLQATLPPDMNGLVVTGPYMPTESKRRLAHQAQKRPRQHVLPFVAQPEALLSRADRVVTMGGYNTTCEILSFEKQALIVPRVTPRQEQLIRAERLAGLGVLDYLHPADLTPHALTTWLARPTSATIQIRAQIDLNGLTRLPGLLDEVRRNPHQRANANPLRSPLNLDRQDHLFDLTIQTAVRHTPMEAPYVVQ